MIVVDNGGPLDANWPEGRVRVLAAGANVGYARAANLGLTAARGEGVLVLNQDVVVSAEAVRALMAGGTAAGAWLAGPQLVDEAGAPAPAKVRFPHPLRWEAASDGGRHGRAVPWISGAAMVLLPGHTDLRFDERFFMYAEDEELCFRIWRAGGSVVLIDEAVVTHAGGTASARRWSARTVTLRTVANRARMVRWHAGWGAVPRYLLALTRRR